MGELGIRFRYWFKHSKPIKRKEILEREISQFCPGCVLKDYAISDLNNLDIPFTIIEKFWVPDWPHEIGEGKLNFKLPTVVIHISGTNKEKKRYPVWSNYTRLKEYNIEIVLPKDYEPTFLPQPLEIKTPYALFSYDIENHGDTIEVHILYKQDVVKIPLEGYEEYKEMNEKIRKLNEEIVLAKNER